MNPYASKSESFKKLNPHLFAPNRLTDDCPAPCKKRLRQSNQPLMNKTEFQFYEHLQLMGWPHILIQSIKLRIGNGVWYCPDFVSYQTQSPMLLYLWEVKGFMRDDAAVKIKVAATMFPLMNFNLAWKKDGQWLTQRILA